MVHGQLRALCGWQNAPTRLCVKELSGMMLLELPMVGACVSERAQHQQLHGACASCDVAAAAQRTCHLAAQIKEIRRRLA